jgi:DNA-binding transcriptional LysR family regulator
VNLEQIQTFLAVYQHGTYHKAAEALYVPQPTVSHRISQLERSLGKALLVRGKGKVALTEEGKVFLPYARQMMAALQEGIEAVEKLGAGEIGKLTIGCNNAIAASVMPAAMHAFMRAHPNVQVRIHCHSSKELARLMKMKQFRISLTRYAVASDRVITYRCLFTEPIRAIVPRGHPLAEAGHATLDDILRYPIMAYPKDTSTRSVFEMILNHCNIPHRIRFETNNLRLLRDMLLWGEGVLLFASSFFHRDLESGALAAVSITDNPFPPSSIFVAFRSGELNGLELKFVEHMEAWLKGRFAVWSLKAKEPGARGGQPADGPRSDKVIDLTRRAP